MFTETQQSLFETQPLISDNPVAKDDWIKNFKKNDAVAFGITYSGLFNGSYYVLENLFYGDHNLEIPLEMLSIENPSEILSKIFAAGGLKRWNAHLYNLNIPHDFLNLTKYMNSYSYRNKGFRYLISNFKRFSNTKEKTRLKFLLNKNKQNEFVESLFSSYKPSNKEDPRGWPDPNCDGRDKRIYAKILYDKFNSLSEMAK